MRSLLTKDVRRLRCLSGSLEYAVKETGLYPYLVDDEGLWTVRKDANEIDVTSQIAEVAASDSNLIHIKAFDLPKQGKSSF